MNLPNREDQFTAPYNPNQDTRPILSGSMSRPSAASAEETAASPSSESQNKYVEKQEFLQQLFGEVGTIFKGIH